jgi:hypothetical protein
VPGNLNEHSTPTSKHAAGDTAVAARGVGSGTVQRIKAEMATEADWETLNAPQANAAHPRRPWRPLSGTANVAQVHAREPPPGGDHPDGAASNAKGCLAAEKI